MTGAIAGVDRIRVCAVCLAIDKAGLVIGDTATVIVANTPEMFEAHFGVPMAGALNTINTRVETETIAYILENSDCRLLIVDTAFALTVGPAMDGCRQMYGPDRVIDIRDPAMGDLPPIGDEDYESLSCR